MARWEKSNLVPPSLTFLSEKRCWTFLCRHSCAFFSFPLQLSIVRLFSTTSVSQKRPMSYFVSQLSRKPTTLPLELGFGGSGVGSGVGAGTGAFVAAVVGAVVGAGVAATTGAVVAAGVGASVAAPASYQVGGLLGGRGGSELCA